MELLILKLIFGLLFSVYVYKISYYYDYRYLGNAIRFFTIYVIVNMIVMAILYSFDVTDPLVSFTIALVLGLTVCVLYRRFLILKFGKEERFASSDVIDEIGLDKKED